MDGELPDFMSETGAAPASEPAPQEAPQEAAPAAEAPPPGGSEATPPAAPSAPPEGGPEPTVTDPQTGHQVPLATYLDMRERANGLETQLNFYRRQEAERLALEANPPPSRDEDPDAYEAHQAQTIDDRMYAMRRDFSRQFAMAQHGPQVVQAAFAWGVDQCDRDEHFNAKVRAHPDPVGFVVNEWRREQLLARLNPNEVEAFLQWKAQNPAAEAPAAPNGAPRGQPPPKPAAPRPSLAAAPSAGKTGEAAPMDGEATYQRMFG